MVNLENEDEEIMLAKICSFVSFFVDQRTNVVRHSSTTAQSVLRRNRAVHRLRGPFFGSFFGQAKKEQSGYSELKK